MTFCCHIALLYRLVALLPCCPTVILPNLSSLARGLYIQFFFFFFWGGGGLLKSWKIMKRSKSQNLTLSLSDDFKSVKCSRSITSWWFKFKIAWLIRLLNTYFSPGLLPSGVITWNEPGSESLPGKEIPSTDWTERQPIY